MQADFAIYTDGGRFATLFLVEPRTEPAKMWVRENFDIPEWGWLGNSFTVEHRYIDDVIQGILDEGFEIPNGVVRL